jgi:hypothetical protein
MAQRNAELALGSEVAPALQDWASRVDELQARARPMRTDNRLDRHEWLRLPDGRLLKCDALDHHQGHDLIGCQDLSWDVAGAIAEFDLDPDEGERLIEAVQGASGRSIDPDLLAFLRSAYLSFRLGQASMSGDMVAGDPAEAARHQVQVARYAAKLRVELGLGEPVRAEQSEHQTLFFRRKPASVFSRNEPDREQTCPNSVHEEEAPPRGPG